MTKYASTQKHIPSTAIFILLFCVSCKQFKETSYIPETRTFNNYIYNYSFVLPEGFEPTDKYASPLKILWNSDEVFVNQEKGTYLTVRRRPIDSLEYGLWKGIRNSVNQSGGVPNLSADFALLFQRHHGKFLNTYEDFLLFERHFEKKGNKISTDYIDAIAAYSIDQRSHLKNLFSITMFGPSSYPTMILDLRNFIFDIELSKFSYQDRVTAGK